MPDIQNFLSLLYDQLMLPIKESSIGLFVIVLASLLCVIGVYSLARLITYLIIRHKNMHRHRQSKPLLDAIRAIWGIGSFIYIICISEQVISVFVSMSIGIILITIYILIVDVKYANKP